MPRTFPQILILIAGALLVSCDSAAEDAALNVAFVGAAEAPFQAGLRIGQPAQHVRAATSEGLVALDAAGATVPALAESWIVTDDGLSYFFRLRNTEWPDERKLTADDVRAGLMRSMSALQGTSLGLDLAQLDEIRAMTQRVVEIRLTSPMPDFLHLLAQPELGLVREQAGAGPMMFAARGPTAGNNQQASRADMVRELVLLPPERRGLPEIEDWRELVRPVAISGMDARSAIDAFGEGGVDLVLGGRLASLPLVDTGPLARGTVRLDPAIGLFGLRVQRADGLLSDPARREAIAMAIDRETLLEPFNIDGWVASTRLVPDGLDPDGISVTQRWDGLSLEQRQAEAARRVAIYDDGTGGRPRLTLQMPAGPGTDILLRELASDLDEIGIDLIAADESSRPDLVLVDRTARYGDARWFLNQFHCSLGRGLCSPEADLLVQQSLAIPDLAASNDLMARAETVLLEDGGFIPLGAPIRWSLVRSTVDGFVENRWSFHPLPPLALRPI
ncbi:hypothetical protein HME9302_02200 [Alteripontixanthobacter maritimus]|uniref:Solute-binding protein family 5 domain-containing protein n=1 Tax=Alteripontixanthobacter maritimus TaxID=2161824 RepID=A0A369Q7X4_9SPHN|nr:ABC transporter substrate-binding protein [Alteripontixanthobacter maritimus]RDC60983.1 hypothetical protein HME9302_02200 [Alteripontixanthobacter maritimus]